MKSSLRFGANPTFSDLSVNQIELFERRPEAEGSKPKSKPSLKPRPQPIAAASIGINEPLAPILKAFRDFGTPTTEGVTEYALSENQTASLPTFVNEYWTASQRAASRLHEVSYRACFKPQLPRFFIERLTRPGDRVYDPFMGRGTTPIEAALLGRVPLGCDVNPLSVCLVRPRLNPPDLKEVARRLGEIDFESSTEIPEELLVFYHPKTLRAIVSLKDYFLKRSQAGTLDRVDDWIRMISLNRLTGHSVGYFSVYSLPPNQATSIQAQKRINEKRNQTPPERDVAQIVFKKSAQLLSDCGTSELRTLRQVFPQSVLLTAPCSQTPAIPDASVDLVVTSPPFLNVVQYSKDNWLRCWFIGIDAEEVPITITTRLKVWETAMSEVFRELFRVVRPGGRVAFEVGEVQKGKVRLETSVIPCGIRAGFTPELVLINDQEFTKTSHCWGVQNNDGGTNTNRIVVFQKA